jgi:hypothetical protein
MNVQTRERPCAIDAHLGYAADRNGRGVAYIRLAVQRAQDDRGEALVRVPFRAQRFAGLDAREVGYAAMTAVADLLHARGISVASFRIADEQLIDDVNQHRDVPLPLVIPYVRLRCALNRFTQFSLEASVDAADLIQRARAEVALHEAA